MGAARSTVAGVFMGLLAKGVLARMTPGVFFAALQL
ncbi:hypothetical protein BurJ1DRAFT_2015 [Burkholderiales bacterium JOSHI_001]|nr:hypothetical protein BurJ1DRAFT_2015 [Burkholderiales bacterium JOSHI_001]